MHVTLTHNHYLSVPLIEPAIMRKPTSPTLCGSLAATGSPPALVVRQKAPSSGYVACRACSETYSAAAGVRRSKDGAHSLLQQLGFSSSARLMIQSHTSNSSICI